MEHFMGFKELVLRCLAVIGRLVDENAENAIALHRANVCTLITSAVSKYTSDPFIVTYAFKAIANLTVMHEDARLCFGESAICELIVDAMNRNMNEDDSVCIEFARAVYGLCLECTSAINDTAVLLSAAGASEVLLRVLRLFGEDGPDIPHATSLAIKSLVASSRSSQILIASAGGCELVLGIMREYITDVNVFVSSCSALDELCLLSADSCERVHLDGVCEMIHDAFDLHKAHLGVDVALLSLLRVLLHSDPRIAFTLLETTSLAYHLTYVMQLYIKSDQIGYLTCEVIGLLCSASVGSNSSSSSLIITDQVSLDDLSATHELTNDIDARKKEMVDWLIDAGLIKVIVHLMQERYKIIELHDKDRVRDLVVSPSNNCLDFDGISTTTVPKSPDFDPYGSVVKRHVLMAIPSMSMLIHRLDNAIYAKRNVASRHSTSQYDVDSAVVESMCVALCKLCRDKSSVAHMLIQAGLLTSLNAVVNALYTRYNHSPPEVVLLTKEIILRCSAK
jgi:hypothetical protein